jgi:hypothetical protein
MERMSISIRARLLALLVSSTVLLASISAEAGEEGGELVLHTQVLSTNVDDLSFHVAPASTEPKPLEKAKLELDGQGTLIGGGLRAVVLGRLLRGGLGLSFYGTKGLELAHAPLIEGFYVRGKNSWAFNIEAFIGKELEAGPVHPYVDLRIAFTIIQATMKLNHRSYGFLGESYYNAYSFGIGPRIGVSIPLNSAFFVDLSGYYGFTGAEGGGVVLGLGGWDR